VEVSQGTISGVQRLKRSVKLAYNILRSRVENLEFNWEGRSADRFFVHTVHIIRINMRRYSGKCDLPLLTLPLVRNCFDFIIM